ncbi:MAG: hypothetical protein ACTSVV_03705 [Promethearchaeota archaeon]
MELVATFFNSKWDKNIEKIPPSLKDFSEDIFKEIDNFLQDRDSRLTVINAPFGVGKTEFEFTCVRKIVSGGKFALYGTLNNIFQCIDENGKNIFEEYKSQNPSKNLDFRDFLDLIINSQIKLIKKIISIKKEEQISFFNKYIILLPEIRKYKDNFFEYLKKLAKECGTTFDTLKNQLNSLRLMDVAVIIDEMEPHYDMIIKYFKTSFKSPFRTLAQGINSKSFPFVMMAFGQKSIYEMAGFGGEVERRILNKRIPIISVEEFPFLKNEMPEYKNFYWWLSRARIGWYLKVKDDFRIYNKLQSFIDNYQTQIEKVKWINFTQIEELVTYMLDSKLEQLFIDALLNLYPIQVNYDNLKEKPYNFKMNEFFFDFASFNELNDIEEIENILFEGLSKIINDKSCYPIILKYIKLILRSISKDNKICFGYIVTESRLAPRLSKREFIKTYFLEPLFSLVHDLIWDFELINEDTKKSLAILEELRKQDNLIEAFEKLVPIFKTIETKQETLYAQLNLKTIYKLFPRPFFSPIIELSDITLQEKIFNSDFEDFVKEIKMLPILINRPDQYFDNNNTLNYYLIYLDNFDKLNLIFRENDSILGYTIKNNLEAKDFFRRENIFLFFIKEGAPTMEKNEDLLVENLSNILINDENDYIQKYIPNKEGLKNILRYFVEINKLNIIIFNEKTLNNFIKSLLYNYVRFDDNPSEFVLSKINEILEKEINGYTGSPTRKTKIERNYNYYYSIFNNQMKLYIETIYNTYKKEFLEKTRIASPHKDKIHNFLETINQNFAADKQSARPLNFIQIFILGLLKNDKIFNEFTKQSIYTNLKNNWNLLKKILNFKNNFKNMFEISTSEVSTNIGYDRLLKNTFGEKNEIGMLNKLINYFDKINEGNYINIIHLLRKLDVLISNSEDILFNDDEINKYLLKPNLFTDLMTYNNEHITWLNTIQLVYIVNQNEEIIKRNYNELLLNFIELFNNFSKLIAKIENYNVLKENFKEILNIKQYLISVFENIRGIINDESNLMNQINKFSSIYIFLLYWFIKKPKSFIEQYYLVVKSAIDKIYNNISEIFEDISNYYNQIQVKIKKNLTNNEQVIFNKIINNHKNSSSLVENIKNTYFANLNKEIIKKRKEISKQWWDSIDFIQLKNNALKILTSIDELYNIFNEFNESIKNNVDLLNKL